MTWQLRLSNRAHEGEKKLGCQKCQNQNKMMRKAEKKIALKWKNPRKRDRTEILDEKRKEEED